MPTRFNQPIAAVFAKLSDGTIVNMSEIKELELEPVGYSNYWEESERMICEPMTFKGVIKLCINNDRNRKSKRYYKNRKGYRGLEDILRG